MTCHLGDKNKLTVEFMNDPTQEFFCSIFNRVAKQCKKKIQRQLSEKENQ